LPKKKVKTGIKCRFILSELSPVCFFLWTAMNLFVFFGPFPRRTGSETWAKEKKSSMPSTKRKKELSSDKKSGTQSRLTLFWAKSL